MSATNGTATVQRKTLSAQLDRLEDILDGLEGLDNAVSKVVTDAVRSSVRAAVSETIKATLAEIFTNPEVAAQVRETFAPVSTYVPSTLGEPTPDEPGICARCWTWTKEAGSTFVTKVRQAWAILVSWVLILWACKGSVSALFGVAGTVAVTSYFLGPVFSAILAGVGGVALVVLITAALAMRKALSMEAHPTPAE